MPLFHQNGHVSTDMRNELWRNSAVRYLLLDYNQSKIKQHILVLVQAVWHFCMLSTVPEVILENWQHE